MGGGESGDAAADDDGMARRCGVALKRTLHGSTLSNPSRVLNVTTSKPLEGNPRTGPARRTGTIDNGPGGTRYVIRTPHGQLSTRTTEPPPECARRGRSAGGPPGHRCVRCLRQRWAGPELRVRQQAGRSGCRGRRCGVRCQVRRRRLLGAEAGIRGRGPRHPDSHALRRGEERAEGGRRGPRRRRGRRRARRRGEHRARRRHPRRVPPRPARAPGPLRRGAEQPRRDREAAVPYVEREGRDRAGRRRGEPDRHPAGERGAGPRPDGQGREAHRRGDAGR